MPAHLPRVEGVSEALAQQCAGASVVLGCEPCIPLLSELPDRVRPQAEADFFIEVVRDFPDYVLVDRIVNPVTIDNQDCKAWL